MRKYLEVFWGKNSEKIQGHICSWSVILTHFSTFRGTSYTPWDHSMTSVRCCLHVKCDRRKASRFSRPHLKLSTFFVTYHRTAIAVSKDIYSPCNCHCQLSLSFIMCQLRYVHFVFNPYLLLLTNILLIRAK